MTGLSRLDTAKSRLSVAWTTASAPSEKKLPDARAVLAELRGDDPRPLLVLRDIKVEEPAQDDAKNDAKNAEPTPDDLVDRSFKNEKLQLATQWFQCIRLGPEVLDERHPFHALFDAKAPARVVLSSADGSRIVHAFGTSSQKLDWKDVIGVLKVDYRKNADSAVRELVKVLNEFDKLDGKRRDLGDQLARANENGRASKIKSLEVKIKKVDAELAKVTLRENELKDLGLKTAEGDGQ